MPYYVARVSRILNNLVNNKSELPKLKQLEHNPRADQSLSGLWSIGGASMAFCLRSVKESGYHFSLLKNGGIKG